MKVARVGWREYGSRVQGRLSCGGVAVTAADAVKAWEWTPLESCAARIHLRTHRLGFCGLCHEWHLFPTEKKPKQVQLCVRGFRDCERTRKQAIRGGGAAREFGRVVAPVANWPRQWAQQLMPWRSHGLLACGRSEGAMKGPDLDTDHEQRIAKALHLLRDAAAGLQSKAFVNVGDVIPVDHEAGYLRGHGTQPLNEELLATVCGVVERVNKLVSVRPLRARYNAETGDVVVGRVTEVGGNRWKVDVNSRKDAELLLAAVNLPGGIQRRRTAIDELNMRDLYVENDLISAEVQSLHQDGSLHLHTRSLKYGKLGNGQLVRVAPYLIKRLKQHFHQLKDLGVDLILGCNGFIWISAACAPGNKDNLQVSGAVTALESPVVGDSSLQLEVRERICRLANSVRVLGALGLLVSPESIIQTYEASLVWEVPVKDMLSADFYVKLAEKEAEQRSKR